MRIIVEEIRNNPNFNIIETTPCAGVKKVKVSVEIEKDDKFPEIGKIINFPYILYVHDLSHIIGDQKNEFMYENLTSHSKKELDEWIKRLNS